MTRVFQRWRKSDGDAWRSVASSHLLLNIFVEVSAKGFGAERHEYGTGAYVYRFQYQARQAR
jgi:hypothetical protein